MNRMRSKNRILGVILPLVSALIFSTAGPFTKGVEAGAWAVVFWRGVFTALFTIGFVFWRGSFAEVSDLFTIYAGVLILTGVLASQMSYLLSRKYANED